MKQIYTTFTCDRCGKKIAFAFLTDRNFSETVISTLSNRQNLRGARMEAYKVLDLCEKCQKSFDEWMGIEKDKEGK